MNTTIIPQLVRKDWMLTRKIILICCLLCLASPGGLYLLYGHIPNWVLLNIAFTTMLAPVATCGLIVLMITNVFEKEKATQVFIMSLPVTAKEFTIAKLLINLPVFCIIWMITSAIAFSFAFGLELFPAGIVPFLTIVFAGVFLAYVCILSVSLIFQSLGITVFSIMFFELATTAYLWVVAFLEPVSRHLYGRDIIWNMTTVTILTTQILVAIFVIALTLFIQNKKKDFI